MILGQSNGYTGQVSIDIKTHGKATGKMGKIWENPQENGGAPSGKRLQKTMV